MEDEFYTDEELEDEADDESEDVDVVDDDSDEPEDENEAEDEGESDATPAEKGDDDGEGDKQHKGMKKSLWAARDRARRAERESAQLRSDLNYIRGKVDSFEEKDRRVDEPELPEIDYADLDGTINRRVEALIAHREAKSSSTKRQTAEQEWQGRLSASVSVAKQTIADFDDVVERFLVRQDENQELARLVRSQPDPASWAYSNQKMFEAAQAKKKDSVADLRARIAELESQQGVKAPRRKSMSRARGSGSTSARVGPKDEGEFFSSVFK